MKTRFFLLALCALTGCILASCSQPEMLSPALRPLSKDTLMLLGKKGMKAESPIYVRIFKEESELEVWKARDDGHYYHFKTYPICNWSGDLGPKVQQGDKQAPEGFYEISKSQMNPNSSFHLAFNIGYPNAFDKVHGRTGSALMVHGKCKSAGCYAMTDALIEEIFALAREQFNGGVEAFPVHAFPFRMTEANMQRHKNHQWYGFWQTMREGYDYFETTRQVPTVQVCEKRYNVNVRPIVNVSTKLAPDGRCPIFAKLKPEPFKPAGEQVAEAKTVVSGPKMRALASSDTAAGSASVMSGLTKTPRKTGGNVTFAPSGQ